MAERKAGVSERVLERWRPIAVALLALIVLNVLAHVLVIRRTGAVSGDREVILASARERVAAARDEAMELERTASKLACARSEISRVFDELLSSKEERLTAILREVRELASSRGVDPAVINYSVTPIKDTGLVRFEIQYPIEGQYATLEDFVKSAEESTNFLIVDQVNITGREQGRLSLDVRLITYFQAPDAEGLSRALQRASRS